MIKQIVPKLAKFETNPYYQYGLLLLITLLALMLRLYKLGEWSFWIDEIYTINRAQVHYADLEAIFRNIPPNRNWVPLSLIATEGVLNIFGINEWSARLVPSLIGIISIPTLYFPIRRLFGSPVALIAVLLLAMSPWHLYWSQNTRFYTSLLLFYSLALFAFFFALERDRLGYILLFIGLTYLATSERLFALFIGPVVAGYLLLLKILPFEKPPGFRVRNIILIILPGIAAALIELYSIVIAGQSRFFGDFGWFFLYHTDDPIRMLGWIGFNIGIPLMCLAFFWWFILTAAKKSGRVALVCWGRGADNVTANIKPIFVYQGSIRFCNLGQLGYFSRRSCKGIGISD